MPTPWQNHSRPGTQRETGQVILLRDQPFGAKIPGKSDYITAVKDMTDGIINFSDQQARPSAGQFRRGVFYYYYFITYRTVSCRGARLT